MPPETLKAGECASTSEAGCHAQRTRQRERQEYSERLNTIRARVRHSLDDPSSDLSEIEAKAALRTMFAEIDKQLDGAAC
jgi:antitoxin ParD1/3/4